MAGDRDRGSDAERRLKSVLVLAMAELEASRSRQEARPRRTGSFVLLLVFIAGTLGLLAFLASHR